MLRGRREDPRWLRPALLGLLLATGVLYLWGLGASGWANSFYSAAVQAGSVSWKAFFYGSSDAANSITVDKPPAALWLMALSVRVFGLNAWSVLVPEALAGIASVGVLVATVRRWFPPSAALLSGLVLAATPVAALMFRFNNPEALLVLLLLLAAYATVRATDKASTGWLVLAGTLVGFGFLTKMLQALLVVPALALVFLLAAPTGLFRRIRQLLLAGLALLVSAGWWIAVVELVPAKYRPYIGGSPTNSILELALGYNGLGRLTGNEIGSVGGGGGPGSGGPGGGRWGQIGWSRLFSAEMGGQIAWLLPAAVVAILIGLWLTRRAPRTDLTRAGFLLWGGWLVVTTLVFSFMHGIIHPYYTVALAPAIAALVGAGAVELWRLRGRLVARAVLAVAVAGTSYWAYLLLSRSSDWQPWLRTAVLVAGLAAVVGLLLVGRFAAVRTAVAGLAVVAILAGPTAYSIATAATPHAGAIPSAGPAGQGGMGGMFPGGRPGGRGAPNGQGGQAGPGGGFPARPNGQGGPNAQGGPGRGFPGGQGGPNGQGAGGMGGPLQGSTPSVELVALLEKDSDSYTWVAATVRSNSAAGYQLATGEPVMPVGGFNGTDPSPTLAQFQAYVAAGRIHYFLGDSAREPGGDAAGRGGNGGQRGGMWTNGATSSSQEIETWVAATFPPTTVGGVTVYDLTTQSGATA
ncbi:glycosyltransferase family 39 protein [Actinopolymorpha pittospori]